MGSLGTFSLSIPLITNHLFQENRSGHSPVRLSRTSPQTALEHSPPPMNLSGLRTHSHAEALKVETPLAVRLGATSQLPTSPLRVQVPVPPHSNRMMAAASPHTHLLNHHSGIMRIATQNMQSNGPVLHRPYSPPRLT